MTKETNAARVLGRKGGQSRSEAKIQAVRENAKKATAARMAKRAKQAQDIA